jgi:citrate synthase
MERSRETAFAERVRTRIWEELPQPDNPWIARGARCHGYALEEMVRTMPYYPPGVLLFESEEPKTLLIKGEVPLLYSWTSTGRVGNR